MKTYHHNTIRKYVGALLSTFNSFEVQYTLSDGTVKDKKVPVVFGDREKSIIQDIRETWETEKSNFDYLPKGYLNFISLVKIDERVRNKLLKENVSKVGDVGTYSFTSVPYEFTFELGFVCRGFSEASQLVEQIAPRFNPVVPIDIWDADNLVEPTRIPVRLLDLTMEHEGYSESSINLVNVVANISIVGNLYQEIREMPVIRKVIETMYTSPIPGPETIDGVVYIKNFDVEADRLVLKSIDDKIDDPKQD